MDIKEPDKPTINPEYWKATHLCVFVAPGFSSIEDQIRKDQENQEAWEKRQFSNFCAWVFINGYVAKPFFL